MMRVGHCRTVTGFGRNLGLVLWGEPGRPVHPLREDVDEPDGTRAARTSLNGPTAKGAWLQLQAETLVSLIDLSLHVRGLKKQPPTGHKRERDRGSP